MLTSLFSANAILLGILLTVGILSLVFARLEPGTRAAGDWGTSILMMGLGYAMLQTDGRVPSLFSVTGEIIMLAGIAVMHGAIRKFRLEENPIWSPDTWGFVAACSVLLLWYTFAHPSARARIIVFSLGLALLLVWAALRSITLPGNMNRAPRRLFTSVIWGVAALFVARAIGTIAAGPHEDEHFRHDTLQPFAATIGVLLLTTLSIALMWMEVSLLNARLARLVSQDVLTGILNHRALMESCERELSRAEHFHGSLSIAMLDIDNFRRVNDDHGHAVGDAVLRHVADLIGADVRKYDTCGRLGGEEFLVIMPQTSIAHASDVMERVRQSMEKTPYMHKQTPLAVTVSIGISGLTGNITGLDALMGAAERALYRAKRGGRNRIETSRSEAGEDADPRVAPSVVYDNPPKETP